MRRQRSSITLRHAFKERSQTGVQWGSETKRAPLPQQHARPSEVRIAWGRLAIVVTVVAWIAYLVTTILRDLLRSGEMEYRHALELIGYVAVVTVLAFSALMYLIARQSALERFRRHQRTPRADLDAHFRDRDLSMTVLVPSYREEPEIIRMTLWSAVLQEADGLHVVLLIDDPHDPVEAEHQALLAQARAIPDEIARLLRPVQERVTAGLAEFGQAGERAPEVALAKLIEDYRWAQGWVIGLAAEEAPRDHVGEFFVDQVLLATARDLGGVASALEAARAEGAHPSAERMLELRLRLVRLFAADLSSFERKQYASLSHEANKAMNLNSYLGLMGGHFVAETTPVGRVLRAVPDPVEPALGGLSVPGSTYVLTLDADSLLLPEYCQRLVYEMERAGNERVAVIQTPYSSYRGAPTRLERLAGATTDLQHVLHQGFSQHNAAFWVGANAIIRYAALLDIEQAELIDGVTVRRFIQDRTPIEDTESSIDLVACGWRLVNYPERLSYSATPTDFGSLVVQRRRWANGGLLILTKFWGQVRERRARGERVRALEIALRVNYMASIAWSSAALLLLLFYPFDGNLLSPLVLLTAAPYALVMAADLRSAGYRISDVLRIYGFNLILLPVNLAGVLKSVEQAITARKIPFARTPKVRDRTASPAWYVIAPLLIIGFSAYTMWHEATMREWGSATFAGVNCLLAAWAFVSYIGTRASVSDIAGAVGRWMQAKPAPVAAVAVAPREPDWRDLLHFGGPEMSPELFHVKPNSRGGLPAPPAPPDSAEPLLPAVWPVAVESAHPSRSHRNQAGVAP